MSKRKSGIILAIVVFFTMVLAILDFARIPLTFIGNGTKVYEGIANTIGLGIDLKDGYYAVLTPKAAEGYDEDSSVDFDNAISILRERLDGNGYTEATITIQGVGASRAIRVEIPEVDNPDDVLKIIGSSGELTFESEQGTVYLTGEDVKNSQAGYDNDGQPIVLLEFTTSGAVKFSNATSKLVGQSLYIKLDGETVSSPKVEEQISSTSATITGLENFETAQSIASVIKAGKLPLEFEIGESNIVSASLGENAIKASLIAGVIGILIIFAIMILKYRGLGVASSLALSIYVTVLIVLLAIVPWIELTLPGIAGIILSIGMAVDANVIIFEGIKEEYQAGKTVVSAVNAGFKRAFLTILDSNVTTVLCAIVLWILCPGSIKGFAMTLLLGVVLSMVTAILATKGILKLLLSLSSNNAKFFNLKRTKEEVEANEEV